MSKRPSLADSMRALSEPTAPNPAALIEKARVPAPSREPKATGKRYEGMKKMLIPLDPAIHRKLKMLAVQNDMTLEKIVQEAISKYISE